MHLRDHVGSKGVIVTHGNILAQSEQLHLAWNFDRHQTFVSWLPHYHDMGLIGMLACIYHGARAVMLAAGCLSESGPMAAGDLRVPRQLQRGSELGVRAVRAPNHG